MAKRSGGVYPIVFLTLVVLLSVVALTLVDAMTHEKILAAQQAEIQEMLSTLFPNLETFRFDEDSGQYTIQDDGEAIGRAMMLQAVGYGGPINILLGMEPDGSLRGIRIISQQETPGLGARIVESEFLDQFAGLSVSDLNLTRSGGAIDAITGATISTRAVVQEIRTAIGDSFGEGGNE